MSRKYSKRESVLKIDTGLYEGMYVFPEYKAEGQLFQSATTAIVGAIKGNASPLVKVKATEDREGDIKLANVDRILGYTEVIVDVPQRIATDIDEYNSLKDEVQNKEKNSEEVSEEDKSRLNKLSSNLNTYFNR